MSERLFLKLLLCVSNQWTKVEKRCGGEFLDCKSPFDYKLQGISSFTIYATRRMEGKITYKKIVFKNNKDGLKTIEDTIHLTLKDGAYGVKDDEVLIKTKAVALNPIDILMFSMMSPWMNFSGKYHGVGHDLSGTIVSVGSEFSKKYDLKVGDEICGFTQCDPRSFSEYLLYNTSSKINIVKKPENMSLTESSGLGIVLTTAINLIDESGITEDSKVLVNGTGSSVGKYVLAVLNIMFPQLDTTVICGERSDSSSKDLGAKTIIHYNSPSLTNDLLNDVKAKPYDVILDITGSEIIIKNLHHLLKPKGTLINIAGGKKHDLSHDSILNVFTWDLIKLHIRTAFGLSSHKFIQSVVPPKREVLKRGVKYISDGALQPVPSKIYKFQQYQEAWDYLKQGKYSGKTFIEFY